MLILSTVNDNIQIVLAAAPASLQPQCFTSWRDITTTAYTPGSLGVNANGTTDVNIVAAPAASTQRVVDFISVYNRDTVAAVVTIKLDVSATETILWNGTLRAGEMAFYSEGSGWSKVSSSGDVIRFGDVQGATDVQEFTAKGNGKWTKPTSADYKYALVTCIGSGGGAGGGGSAAGALNAKGGGGGGGGCWRQAVFSLADLRTAEPVYVGEGGIGGTGGIGAAGDGGDGGNGESTIFGNQQGNHLVAFSGGGGFGGRRTATATGGGGGGGGGGAGAAGSASAGTGGLPTGTVNGIDSQGMSGVIAATTTHNGIHGGGGGGGTSAAYATGVGGSSVFGGGGGGVGSGHDAVPALRAGSAGGAGGSYTAAGGGAVGTDGAAPTAGAAGANGKSFRGGSGGGGGGASITAAVNAAAGGNGGANGGGGGGGGGSAAGGGAGGNGGDGGDGYCVVICF